MNTQPDRPAWTVEELRVELERYEAQMSTARRPRNTITAYVYPVLRFLDFLDRPYSPIRDVAVPSSGISMTVGSGSNHGGRSAYDGLRIHLSKQSEPTVRMSFAEIERIIARPLPNSALHHRAWWANEQSGSHVHARSWMKANPPRHTANVDLNGKTIDFVVI